VTHLKYHDQRGAAMAYYPGDSSSVFFRVVNGEYLEIPQTAVAVLDFFTKPTGTPRWLLHPMAVYGMTPAVVPGSGSITVSPPTG
jgi:hypothetical protein